MVVQKYKATVSETKTEIVGYLIEQREHLGEGCYTDKKQYCIYVTEFSMPDSIIRGGFIVKKESIIKL